MTQNAPKIRLFVEVDLSLGKIVELSDSHAHYLRSVMRQEEGGEIALFNGKDGEYRAILTKLAKKKANVHIVECLKEQVKTPDIWLAFAPIKKHRLQVLVEKATELGVSKLIAVTTRYTTAPKIRADKVYLQAIEAAEQSERMDVPEIREEKSLEKLLENWPEDRTLYFMDESGHGVPALDGMTDKKAAIIIGPEGGFSEEEREIIRNYEKAKAITLGPRILRAETAATVALSLWQAKCGDFDLKPDFQGA